MGVTNMDLRFGAYVSAGGPGARVKFDVSDTLTGERLTSGRLIEIAPYNPPYSWTIFCYCSGIASEPVAFSAGEHDVTLRITDGVDGSTNLHRFEVIAFETALAELNEQLALVESTRKGRRAVAFFRESLDAEHPKRAGQRWKQFVKALAHLPELSEEDRARLQSAADRMRSLLSAQ
jgi:hypothetical protein